MKVDLSKMPDELENEKVMMAAEPGSNYGA